jgi:hypothetical protein
VDEGEPDTVKMVSRLLAAIIMLVVVVVMAPVASARGRHRSRPQTEEHFPEMLILDEWAPDLIVVPPVTRPSNAVYDTPKPRTASVAAVAPAPVHNEVSSGPAATNSTTAVAVFPTRNSIPTGANPTGEAAESVNTSPSQSDAPASSTASNTTSDAAAKSSLEHATTSSMEIMSAAVNGAKIDGASITAPQGGVQIAALVAPSTAELKKEIAGASRSRTPGSILFDQTHDDSTLYPENWSVCVFKKRQALIVYYKGRLFKQYDAVFGRALDLGAKQWAQDRRTPEGVYTIIEKYPSGRFRWFLRLNYPNLVDRVRYETERVNGVVPVDGDGKSPTVGSAIGIHGTDVPILNAGHINWTTGCISVNNNDIDSLERVLPVGTVVIIKP